MEGIPREWVQLFKGGCGGKKEGRRGWESELTFFLFLFLILFFLSASGIKAKELKDPDTVVFLLDTMFVIVVFTFPPKLLAFAHQPFPQNNKKKRDKHMKDIKKDTPSSTNTSTPSSSEQPQIHKSRSAADRSKLLLVVVVVVLLMCL